MSARVKKIFAFILSVMLILSCGCSKAGTASSYASSHMPPVSDTSSAVFERGSIEALLDGSGRIDSGRQVALTASAVKRNSDGRRYISHNGKPYFFNSVYWDLLSLQSDKSVSPEDVYKIFEEGFGRAYDAGYRSVSLSIDWSVFYDGSRYSFSAYEIYYDLAKKYDMAVQLIWNGYNYAGGCRFMPWQTDRSVYTALKLENTQSNKEIPDLAVPIYADEEADALNQLCAWLNYYDKDARTVSIQLADSPNSDSGTGKCWSGQFPAMLSLLERLGKTVKQSAYRMVTCVSLSASDIAEESDGMSYRQRLHGLIDSESIDMVGTSGLTLELPNLSGFEYGNNIPYISALTPITGRFVSQCAYAAANGYGIVAYELRSFRENDFGLFKADGKDWVKREEGFLSGSLFGKDIITESNYEEIALMNKCFNDTAPLLATLHSSDIITYNLQQDIACSSSRTIGKTEITFTFNRNESAPSGQGGVAAALVDVYGAYYLFASRSGGSFLIDGKVSQATVGSYVNGAWNPSDEAVTLSENNSFTAEAGKVYRILLK